MTKFNEGDRVKITGVEYPHMEHVLGTEGVVARLFSYGERRYYVKFSNDQQWAFKADELVPVAPEIQVGDTVSVTGVVDNLDDGYVRLISFGWVYADKVEFVSRPASPERTVTLELTEAEADELGRRYGIPSGVARKAREAVGALDES